MMNRTAVNRGSSNRRVSSHRFSEITLQYSCHQRRPHIHERHRPTRRESRWSAVAIMRHVPLGTNVPSARSWRAGEGGEEDTSSRMSWTSISKTLPLSSIAKIQRYSHVIYSMMEETGEGMSVVIFNPWTLAFSYNLNLNDELRVLNYMYIFSRVFS